MIHRTIGVGDASYKHIFRLLFIPARKRSLFLRMYRFRLMRDPLCWSNLLSRYRSNCWFAQRLLLAPWAHIRLAGIRALCPPALLRRNLMRRVRSWRLAIVARCIPRLRAEAI